MIEKPLLSICIPTYNRAELLRDNLEHIVSDPDFDDEVEIVISDHCSTDETRTVGEEYAKKTAGSSISGMRRMLGTKTSGWH